MGASSPKQPAVSPSRLSGLAWSPCASHPGCCAYRSNLDRRKVNAPKLPRDMACSIQILFRCEPAEMNGNQTAPVVPASATPATSPLTTLVDRFGA
jgi:hypothetical protein